MRGRPVLVDASVRELFEGLVAGALAATRTEASRPVVGYLVDLMGERVRIALPEGGTREREPTLAEALLQARRQGGPSCIPRLRALGDRALFVSGFFGESLTRSPVDLDYYGDVGRIAYGDLAAILGRRLGERSFSELYEELADRFLELVDVLAEVSERAGVGRTPDLLRIYERYLRTGSPRDRRRLLLRGCVPPQPRRPRFWQ
jgi:hypothetical protein